MTQENSVLNGMTSYCVGPHETTSGHSNPEDYRVLFVKVCHLIPTPCSSSFSRLFPKHALHLTKKQNSTSYHQSKLTTL